MKLLSSIKKLTQKLQTKKFIVAGIVAISAGMAFGAVQAEFYPDRQPFDYNKPCNPDDADIYDRCGSLTGPVFNSFINTPNYGDERAFADARRSDQATSGTYKNVLPDVTEGSKEIVIRTYIHNNANESTNASGQGVATGVNVRVLLPTNTAGSMRARSYISATNASLVEDTVDFTATEKFRLEYIPGSATLYNYGPFAAGTTISDSIVTTGAPIGYDALNGVIPGCFDYASVVEIRVKVVPEEKPSVELTKVTKDNKTGSTWGEETKAAPGETVNWLVGFKNSGNQDLTHVTINDQLPPHVSVIPGTVRYIDAGQDTVLPDDGQFFTTGGYDFLTWKPGSNFYVRFQTTTLDNFDGCEVRVRNVVSQKTDQVPSTQDTADLVIKKQNCTELEPVVVCVSLTAPTLSLNKGESTVFTAVGTAKDTTINGYIFTVNGTEVKNSNNANDNTYTYTAGNAGSYIVTATVKSPAGNVTSDNCVKTVTVEEEKLVICENLTANKYAVRVGEKVTFTAKGKATNTTITEYEFLLNDKKGGQSASKTFEYTPTKAGTFFVRVYVHSADGQRVTSGNCVKSVDVEEVPEVVCRSLTAPVYSLKVGESTVLTVNATKKNATITGYIFTVNGLEVQNSASNKYTFKGDKAGEYDIVATVKSSIGNVTSDSCVKTVDVIKEIVPIYRCESFTLNKSKLRIGERFVINVRVTAKDGATFKQATFTFGDEASDSEKTIVNSIKDGVVTVDHSYAKSGNFGPRVKLAFMVNDKMVEVEDPKCVGQVTVEPTEVKGVKTTVLPNTGAGSIAGLMASVTVAGTALHRRFTLKRTR